MRRSCLLGILLTVLLAVTGCGGGGGDGGILPVGGSGLFAPNGTVSVSSPNQLSPAYKDTVYISGSLNSDISSVSYTNKTNGASGSCQIVTYGYENCYPLFGCTWIITARFWKIDGVPIVLGENTIQIFGNGLLAAVVYVTRKPSVQIGGTVSFNGVVQPKHTVTIAGIVDNRSYSDTAVTDDFGNYTLRFVPPGFQYTLRATTPQGACVSFMPLFVVNSPGTYNLTTTGAFGGLSGKITTASSVINPYDIHVELFSTDFSTKYDIDQPYSATDLSYGFKCIPVGSYAVKPTYGARIFNPASTFVNISSNRTKGGIDFTLY